AGRPDLHRHARRGRRGGGRRPHGRLGRRPGHAVRQSGVGMDLYSFFNSSTSYRVRIVLALKQLDFNLVPVNIRVMEHKEAGYVAKNPGASVPLLDDDGFELGQSMAIIDYLDTKYPE